MAETVDSKPVFREAFKQRRCLVPIEAFYEWQKLGPKEKQPSAISLAAPQETVRSFTIITTTPNELCAPIHNRMPVILSPKTWPEWLGEQPAEEPQLKKLLGPYPAERMTLWPVDKRVGNVKNNDPSLIEPVSLS
jgi:putative SOS response-associated peptidase YedK